MTGASNSDSSTAARFWGDQQLDLARVVAVAMFGNSNHCCFCGRRTVSGTSGGRPGLRAHPSGIRAVENSTLPRCRSHLLTRDAARGGIPRFWVDSCMPCSAERSGSTLPVWREHLSQEGDYRVGIVDNLLRILRQLGVSEECIVGIDGYVPECGHQRFYCEALEPEFAEREVKWKAVLGKGNPSVDRFGLTSIVARRLGVNQRTCLTCRQRVVRGSLPRRAGKDSPPDPDAWKRAATRGHLLPSIYHRKIRRYWILQCGKCNGEQGASTLLDWYRYLRSRRDDRADLVRELLITLVEIGLSRAEIGGSEAGGDDDWYRPEDARGESSAGSGLLGKVPTPGGSSDGRPSA